MQVFDVYLFSLDVQKSMHMYIFSDFRDFWTCTIVQDNFVSGCAQACQRIATSMAVLFTSGCT